MKKRFGIMTTGGDCPGLNAVIYSIYRNLKPHKDIELFGIYQNAIHATQPYTIEKITYLDPLLPSRSGTILGSMVASDLHKFEAGRSRPLALLEDYNLDGVFLIGGDGSIEIAKKFFPEYPFIIIPKTIDNDVAFTDCSIGFCSAVGTVTSLLDNLKNTGYSHRRIMVAEVMGRDTGFIALESGVAAFADAILIPEQSHNEQALKEFLLKRYDENQSGALVVVAEGVTGMKEFMETQIPIPSRYTILGHLQRGGAVCETDRLMASYMGAHAVKLARDNMWRKMVIWRDYQASDIDIPKESVKRYVSQAEIDRCEELDIFISSS
ncbi:MAG: ATP-dependent 6-phosphofructokinase [Alphaproteobacteria bacterium]|nr:MAG: ATP-dependent 6-phosphofructokinase [Alphaproteobacteria bacterium]